MFALSVAARIAVTAGFWALGYYTGRRYDGLRRAETPQRFRLNIHTDTPQVAPWVRAAMS